MRFLIIGLVFVNNAFAAVELNECKPHLGSEEVSARRAAEKAKLSDAEVLARLILSESLSTGFWKGRCEASSSRDLMEAIGWGILNRVKKNRYYDVVFQKNQFRTSFSGKKGNPFAVTFLCPLKGQTYLDQSQLKDSATGLYSLAQEVAQKQIELFEKEKKIPSRFRGITNFFYPKSEFFGESRPAWAKNSDPTRNPGYFALFQTPRPCAEFYRLAGMLETEQE